MKKIILSVLVASTLAACGQDNLNKSSAKEIVEACLEKKPEDRFVTIKKGEVLIDPSGKPNQEKVRLYKELEKDGFLTFTLTNKKHPIYVGAQFYDLVLTDKASKYINQSKKNGDYVMLKSFRYEIDEVMEIQEIPAYNMAKVKVRFKPVEVTPFSILPGGTPEQERVRAFEFKKTDSGWKYCD